MSVSRRWLLLAGGAATIGVGCKRELKPAAACVDTRGLTEAEVQVRSALGYVDRAAEAQKSCAACQQYVAATEDGACGGCHLLKGPIHPLGTCKAFALRAT